MKSAVDKNVRITLNRFTWLKVARMQIFFLSNQTIFTSTFRPLSETFVERNW